MTALIKAWAEKIPLVAGIYRYGREEMRRSKADFSRKSALGFAFEGNELMHRGLFEPKERECIEFLLKDADIFVDVGANIGFYTCIARSMGKQAIAIEPMPDNLWWLFMNLKANGWENTEVFPLVVGSKPGMIEIYGASTGATTVEGWAGQPKAMKRFVPSSTLDKLVEDRIQGKKALIKVDVEGGELSVLEGSLQILKLDPKPIWLMEVCYDENHPSGMNPHYKEVFDLMFRAGYKVRAAEIGSREISPQEAYNHSLGSAVHNYIFYT